MATNIKIIKLKIRRGSDEQRKQVVLDQGELGYTLDTKRMFIGDGTTLGGNIIGNKVLSPIINYTSLQYTNAQKGDIVLAKNKLYMLSGADYTDLNSWGYIGTYVDDSTIDFDTNNNIRIKPNSVSTTQLDSSITGNGIEINGSQLQASINTSFFEFSGGDISIKASTITEREVTSSALSSGLVGGDGDPIKVKVGTGLGFDSTQSLVICSFPANTVDYNSIDPALIGSGLTLDSGTETLIANVAGVDGVSITKDSSNTLQLLDKGLAVNIELPYVEYNTYGIANNITSAIYSTLTGNSVNTSFSAFNGFPGQTNPALSGDGTNSENVYTYPALDVDGNTVQLSSAGFICFANSVSARGDETIVERFAIPVFNY